MFNRQAIFDKVAKHLLKTRAKAKSADGSCAYRGVDGAMCAIGCLIPDSTYDPAIEGLSPHSAWEYNNRRDLEPMPKHRMLARILSDETGAEEETDFAFLNELQCVHDISEVENWALDLAAFAANHGLDTPTELKNAMDLPGV